MTTDVEIWARERLLEALESHHRGQSESPYVKKWGDFLHRRGRGE